MGKTEKIKLKEKLDLIELIDSVTEQGHLNENEATLLHKFRKRRNEFVHENGATAYRHQTESPETENI